MSVSHYSSAREMIAALQSKQISARELLDLHLARHQKTHDCINAIIRTDIEAAQKQAALIDDARARGESLGPLAGIPITVKDCFDVSGMPAHCGNPDLAARALECEDAVAIARAKRAGAIIWGKSNVPPMLQGWQSANTLYGVTNNPFDLSRSAGGSSGGAAAALASGVTPLEIGSDVGGSLRVPAHFCGVCALKPTWGLIPQAGHIIRPPEFECEIDLNVIGPMARTIGDLRVLMAVLTDTPAEAGEPNAPLRVAVWTDGLAIGRDCGVAVERAAEALRRQGSEVRDCRPPVAIEHLLVAYRDLLLDALSYDGAPRPAIPRSARPLFKLRRAFGADALSMAGYGLAFTANPKQIAHARQVRDRLKAEMAAFFQDTDIILCPAAPGAAFTHDHSAPLHMLQFDLDGRPTPMLHHLHWAALASALHLPALVVPAGRTPSGLPTGVQLLTRWNDEAVLFNVGELLEATLGGFQSPIQK